MEGGEAVFLGGAGREIVNKTRGLHKRFKGKRRNGCFRRHAQVRPPQGRAPHTHRLWRHCFASYALASLMLHSQRRATVSPFASITD